MNVIDPAGVKTVAVIGAGTIGASWAAFFLARGLTVQASDPGPGRDGFIGDYVRNAWPALRRLGMADEDSPAAALARLSFDPNPVAVLRGADFVQESAPEREELKRDLIERIDAALPPDRVIASSTSGFGVSVLQGGMARPERLVIGHPFNPPHLIPLVEVVGGGRTAPEAVRWALDFYRRLGKQPIHVRKEVPGHLANRLQVALLREAVHLVDQGVASVADVDAAIAYGPGLRWAIMGPYLTFHLAGGAGGIAHWADHLGPATQAWWDDLGSPRLTAAIRDKLVEGVAEEVGGRTIEDLASERDACLLDILESVQRNRTARDGEGRNS